MIRNFTSAIEELSGDKDDIEVVLARLDFGVFVDHVEKGCIYANDEVLRMFEMDWESFQGFGWAKAVLPEDMETLREAIERYEKEKTQIEVHYRVQLPGGGQRALHVVGKAIVNDAGEQQGSVMIGRDVTHERAAQDRTIQSQKLEAIGRLSGRIAHDFNNVLTPISLSASMLEACDLSAEGKHYVETIHKSVEHASGITHQLLGLSRHQMYDRRVSIVDAEVAALSPLLTQLLGEGIQVNLCLDAGNAEVGLASQELGQIIINLAVNGRDAMSDGGALTISTRLRDSVFELCVTDSGSGIPAAIGERIYEAFFTAKPSDRGTGLGLHTVQDLVKRSGGSIAFETELNRGTTFTVTLPCLGTGEVQAPAFHSATDLAPLRVLIVDDNSALRQTLAFVLALRGHDVESSSSIARAELLLEQNSYDVVVCDILLPDGNGSDFVAQARKTNPGLRAVLMTGFSDQSHDSTVIDAPRTALLLKPFHPNLLTRAIAEVVRDERI